MTETKSLELPPMMRRRERSGDVEQGTRQSGSPLRWVAAVVVLLLVAAAWLSVLASRESAIQESRTAALESAKTRIPTLLSYDHSTLKADLATAASMTTGAFKADYQKILDEVVTPTAATKQIDTIADITEIGVVEESRDRVVVLAFVTQTTVAKGTAPAITASRIEVTLVPAGGQWLISDLEPV